MNPGQESLWPARSVKEYRPVRLTQPKYTDVVLAAPSAVSGMNSNSMRESLRAVRMQGAVCPL